MDLRDADIRRITRAAPNLQSLAELEARKHADLPAQVVGRLREAARLSLLPGITLQKAAELARADVTRAVLARDPDRAADLAERHGIPTLAIIAAARIENAPLERVAVQPFHDGPPKLPVVRRVVVDRSTSWLDIAAEHYDVPRAIAGQLRRRLATANRADPESEVAPGARVLLPEIADHRFRIP